MLGLKTDAEYLATREANEAELVRKRKERKQEQEAPETAYWHPYADSFSAYLAGDFAALHDLEQSQAKADDVAAERQFQDVPF